MPVIRRSHLEMQLGRFLRFGQHFRRRADGTVWVVVQIHRVDCVVVLRRGTERAYVSFLKLRDDFKWIALHDQEAV